MVKLEEVTDEHFTHSAEEEEWDTDSESDASSTISDLDETFSERIYALRDIIPARRRAQVSSAVERTASVVGSTLSWGGKALWVVSTSALLLGVPWMLAYADDQQMAEMEQQMKMQASANEFMTQGVQPGQADSQDKAGL